MSTPSTPLQQRRLLNMRYRRHSTDAPRPGGNDFQLGRQLELQRQLQHVANIECYRRVRGEVVAPGSQQLAELDRTVKRSSSAPLDAHSDNNGRQSSGYLTDDGYNRPPTLPEAVAPPADKHGHVRRYLVDVYKYQHLHKVTSYEYDPVSFAAGLEFAGRLSRLPEQAADAHGAPA